MLAFIIIFVGVLSSVATDAGYLILIPLGAAAFLSVGRHPLAGLAAAFAGVGADFGVNMLITPLDSMLTEITNEAIGLVAGETPITITANFYFAIASSIFLAHRRRRRHRADRRAPPRPLRTAGAADGTSPGGRRDRRGRPPRVAGPALRRCSACSARSWSSCC